MDAPHACVSLLGNSHSQMHDGDQALRDRDYAGLAPGRRLRNYRSAALYSTQYSPDNGSTVSSTGRKCP